MMNVIEKEVDSMKKMLDNNEQRQNKTTSMCKHSRHSELDLIVALLQNLD